MKLLKLSKYQENRVKKASKDEKSIGLRLGELRISLSFRHGYYSDLACVLIKSKCYKHFVCVNTHNSDSTIIGFIDYYISREGLTRWNYLWYNTNRPINGDWPQLIKGR